MSQLRKIGYEEKFTSLADGVRAGIFDMVK